MWNLKISDLRLSQPFPASRGHFDHNPLVPGCVPAKSLGSGSDPYEKRFRLRLVTRDGWWVSVCILFRSTWGTIYAGAWCRKVPATRTPSLGSWVLLTSSHSQYRPAPSLKRGTYRLAAWKANERDLPFDGLNAGILGLPMLTNTKGRRFPALPAGNSRVRRAKRPINFSS